MATRLSWILTSAAVVAFSASPLVCGTVALAQDVQPQVENAKHAFEGVINSSAFVRSGPGDSFYPTMKLDKGAKVKVVGIKFNWLKIEPPAGSFSYVSRAYVQRRGDAAGGIGRVANTINVRAGSDLVAMKTTVQTKLEAGADVKILGEQEEYFKIAPPEGAYLYVDQKFVDPVKRLPQPGEGAVADDSGAAKPANPTTGEGATAKGDETGDKTTQPGDEGVKTVTPEKGSASAHKSAPGGEETTGIAAAPAATDAPAKFAELEAKFQAESAKPLTEQPIDEMVASYQAFAQTPNLGGYYQRAADSRLASLKQRQEAKADFVSLKQKQDAMKKQQQALSAEGEELAERIKQNDVKVYSAVGVLRTSSLQLGREPLYRLTDPATGRTVVYIRSSETLLPPLMDQFIGVRGTLGSDPQLSLRVIENINSAEAVDQTKVNGAVAAQIVPPSLLPRVPTADATKEQTSGATEPQ